MKKLDITTIILTYNEEIHIRRCLENVCPFSKHVIVVDSPSTDRTVEICNSINSATGEREFPEVEVVVHKYPGNQAEQFNWALDNLDIRTEWILRMDADEYLLPELTEELYQVVPALAKDVTGIEFKRRHIFMEKWVKHGIYPVVLMRMFRKGCGRYDARLMDEHIALSEGRSIIMKNDFCDHSLINVSDYCRKHINYAKREACEILNEYYDISKHQNKSLTLGAQAKSKHRKKNKYNKLPLFGRSFFYFCYRYFLRGGFLDGKEGFLFAFLQGWWYRTLVDAKILEVRKSVFHSSKKPRRVTEEEKEQMRSYIEKSWGIRLK
ncbi:MAG: glycosyltransferase family 2 protein [Bacteroidales bacterium]|nr:glycosyltransferase family 2 protein [Candidatus Physcousia equi]